MKTQSKTYPWATILTIIFVVLKLCHVIDWSWWWVLSPFLITIAFLIVGIIIYVNIK